VPGQTNGVQTRKGAMQRPRPTSKLIRRSKEPAIRLKSSSLRPLVCFFAGEASELPDERRGHVTDRSQQESQACLHHPRGPFPYEQNEEEKPKCPRHCRSAVLSARLLQPCIHGNGLARSFLRWGTFVIVYERGNLSSKLKITGVAATSGRSRRF